MKLSRIIIFFLLLSAASSINGQNLNTLTIRAGDNVPDSVFQYIVEKSGKSSAIPDLFILDFWATSCSSCMNAFSKVNTLQQQFANRVQFVLVNSTQDQQVIDQKLQLINNNRKAIGRGPILLPTVPGIAGDGYLRKIFPYLSVPHHVWISKDRKVIAITNGETSNFENIQNYLNGELVTLQKKKDFAYMNTNRPLFLSPDVDDEQVSHYSLLIKGDAGSFRRLDSIADNRFVVMNKPLSTIYESLADKFIPLLRHGNVFIEVDTVKLPLLKISYTFDFIVPKKSSDSLYHYALNELNRYTGFNGRIEKRKMPCYVLSFSKGGKSLVSKGGKGKNTLYAKDHDKQSMVNGSWINFIAWISATARKSDPNRVLADETGLAENVDVEFNEKVVDYPSLRKALRSYGLDLQESEREIEVFVLGEK